MSSTQRRPVAVERDHLIESNLSLARVVARRYAGRGADLDDLVQVGAVGLIKAADGFDPTRGVAFTTFATRRIEGEIRHHLRDQTSSVRIPRELQRLGGELRRCRADLAARLGRSPTVSELASALNTDDEQIERALVAERARDSNAGSPDDPGAELVGVPEPFATSDDRLLLAAGLRTLDERERRLIYLRFHADMTERQIAQEVGISQAHVSRLLTGALAKLRNELARSNRTEGHGDTTQTTVISPQSEGVGPPPKPSPGGPGSAKAAAVHASTGRVADVGAPKTVAKHVELPYEVALRSERDGDQVFWSATVEGLPDCSARGATPEEAVEQLRPVMESWLTAAVAEARGPASQSVEVSKPKATPSHSGRFLVRMPGALHEELARAAERKNVSLNRFVTDALAAAVGAASSEPASRAASPEPPSPATSTGEPPTTPETKTRRPSGRTVRIALAANLVVVVFAALIATALLVLALERGI